MTRLVDVESGPMSADQQRVFEAIRSGPRGLVQGPLRIWLHSPELADRSQSLGAYCRYGTGLDANLTELAIIVIAAFWKSGFEWHVHAPLAAAAGVAAESIDAILSGDEPGSLCADEMLIYGFTRALIAERRVPEPIFTALEARFGPKAVVDLVGLIGYYSYIAMTILAFEVETPGGDPFA